MFGKYGEDGFRLPAEGVGLKTRVYGDKTLMVEFVLKRGSSIPSHAHHHEQTGYLVRGHIRLTIDDRTHDVEAGDAWCIPGGVPHRGEVIEDSVAIEVFSPVREDYLKYYVSD